MSTVPFPILGPGQYGHHFAYDVLNMLKYDFYENLCNLIETSLKFVHKDPMNNMPAFSRWPRLVLNVFFFSL